MSDDFEPGDAGIIFKADGSHRVVIPKPRTEDHGMTPKSGMLALMVILALDDPKIRAAMEAKLEAHFESAKA